MRRFRNAAFAACFVLGAGAVSASEPSVVADIDPHADGFSWARIMEGARDVTSPAALKSCFVAVGHGFLHEPNCDRSDALSNVVVTPAQQPVRQLAFKRANLTLDSEPVLPFAKRNIDATILDKVEIVLHGLAPHLTHIATRRDFPDATGITANFTATLAEVRRDDGLDARLKKHVKLQKSQLAPHPRVSVSQKAK